MSETFQDQNLEDYVVDDDANNFSVSSDYEPTDSSLSALSSDALQTPSEELYAASRKRKIEISSTTRNQSRRKRLKPYYSDSYRELFNEAVFNAVDDDIRSGDEDLKSSQIGISTWSASEKSLFFNNLARKGRDDICGIATAIGTKTEPEVQTYLLLLDEASTKQKIYSPTESLPGQIGIPAASELSEACEYSLENAADALAILQQKDDEKAEKQKHGKQWRLTPKHGEIANRRLRRDQHSEAQGSEPIPEANLLNLENFFPLTKLFYMNSTDPEYHWQTYAVDRDERPSIFYTAFSDFHNLVLSVTRRLVRSAIFFAMSRLRAKDGSRVKAHRQVRREDVIAAINVLGMKKDRHEYWARLARRCKLNVYEADDAAEKGSKRNMNYDMVEQELDRRRDNSSQCAQTPPEVSCRVTSLSSETTSSVSSDSAPKSTTSTADFEPESNSSSNLPLDHRSPETINAQDRRDREEDAYISALDQQASLREEQCLWDLLGKNPPSSINPDEIKIPRKPRSEPKPLEDVGDWRKWTHYAPEWEVVGASTCDWSRQRAISHFDHNEPPRKTLSGTRRKGKERVAEPMMVGGVEDESVASHAGTPGSAGDEDLDDISSRSSKSMLKASSQGSVGENQESAGSADATQADKSGGLDESSAQSDGEGDSEDSSDEDD